MDTAIRALLFVLQFLQVSGITEKELADTERLYDKAVALAQQHQKTNPFFITVPERKDG